MSLRWAEPAADTIERPTAWQTFRHVLAPHLAPAWLAGGMLAFAVPFDEIVVTLFTSGHEPTLPIWFFNELFRPRNRPVTNVVTIAVVAVTLIPILRAYRLTGSGTRRRARAISPRKTHDADEAVDWRPTGRG